MPAARMRFQLDPARSRARSGTACRPLFFWHEIQDSGALCAVKGLFQAAVRIGFTFADTAWAT